MYLRGAFGSRKICKFPHYLMAMNWGIPVSPIFGHAHLVIPKELWIWDTWQSCLFSLGHWPDEFGVQGMSMSPARIKKTTGFATPWRHSIHLQRKNVGDGAPTRHYRITRCNKCIRLSHLLWNHLKLGGVLRCLVQSSKLHESTTVAVDHCARYTIVRADPPENMELTTRSTHFSCVSKLIGQNQHTNTGKNDYFILKANHEVAFWIHPPDGNQPKTRCACHAFVRRRVLKWFAWPHMLLAFLNVCREGIISTFSASLYVAFFVTCTTWRRECRSDNLRRVSHAMSMSCLKVIISLMWFEHVLQCYIFF